jgi:hypothetical protein
MRHTRTFKIELIGARDTLPELLKELERVQDNVGSEVPHRILSIDSAEFVSSRFGTVGHRWTVCVDIVR